MDGGETKPYGGGDGTKEKPYLISSAADLAQLANDVASTPNFSRGRYFKLTADIVINEGVNAVSQTDLQNGKAFPQTAMIGDYAGENDYTPFQGVFDGDGHVISGFYTVPNANYVGLFRVLEGAEIRNLGLKDCFVYAGAYLSCLAGLVKDSRIINCYVVDSKPVMPCAFIVSAISRAGLTQMRSKPRNCSAYMPPMDVPMMRSGFSCSQMEWSRAIASCGSTGRSGAMTLACGMTVRRRVTVPDWPLLPKP